MAYRLTNRAEADLLSIAEYTRGTWGEAQTTRYIEELQQACSGLAAYPGMGRASDELKPGLRRMEHGRHVVFYEPEPGGILIVRILHQRMVPGRVLHEEDADL